MLTRGFRQSPTLVWAPVRFLPLVVNAAYITVQPGGQVRNRHPGGGGCPNRIHVDGEVLEPREFEDAIVHGFSRVYEWFQHDAARATRCVSDLFGDTSVRFVGRATQIYTQLLIGSRHPRFLIEPLEVDLVFEQLSEDPHRWDHDRQDWCDLRTSILEMTKSRPHFRQRLVQRCRRHRPQQARKLGRPK